jgi:hypothetical protein
MLLGYLLPRFTRLAAPALLLVSLAGFCSAQSDAQTDAQNRARTAAAVACPLERTALAESFTLEKLWRWQKRLQLEDWKITVVVARASEMKPKTLGNIHWDTDTKTATIRVLDPADYEMSQPDMLKDMEFTVVHELIHLELASVLSPLSRNDASRREEEHAVNHMADALLKLDRGQ